MHHDIFLSHIVWGWMSTPYIYSHPILHTHIIHAKNCVVSECQVSICVAHHAKIQVQIRLYYKQACGKSAGVASKQIQMTTLNQDVNYANNNGLRQPAESPQVWYHMYNGDKNITAKTTLIMRTIML